MTLSISGDSFLAKTGWNLTSKVVVVEPSSKSFTYDAYRYVEKKDFEIIAKIKGFLVFPSQVTKELKSSTMSIDRGKICCFLVPEPIIKAQLYHHTASYLGKKLGGKMFITIPGI